MKKTKKPAKGAPKKAARKTQPRKAARKPRKAAKSATRTLARKLRTTKTETKRLKAIKTALRKPTPKAPPPKKMPRTPPMLTTGQVAELCAVSGQTVARWVDSGLLKGHLFPGTRRRRVLEADLIRFKKKYGIPDFETPTQ